MHGEDNADRGNAQWKSGSARAPTWRRPTALEMAQYDNGKKNEKGNEDSEETKGRTARRAAGRAGEN